MRRAFSSLGCPDASFPEICALARQFGLARLELRSVAGTIDLPAWFGQQFGDPAGLAAAVAAEGLTVVALDTSFRLIDHAPADRVALLAWVPWAEALGGVNLRIFDGGQDLSDTAIDRAVETLAWWADARTEAGWQTDLMIETHDTLVTSDAVDQLVRAAAAVEVVPRLLWDAHHTWRKGGEDPVATWTRVRDLVVHLHVKDSVGVPSARHPFTYTLPGDGDFPMADLLARLRSDGYAGVLSLEWERKWHPYLPPLADALTVAAARHWWG